MGLLKDLKKAKKKNDARMKKIDKMFGAAPKKSAPAKAVKEKEPKEVNKNYKMTGIDKNALLEALDDEVDICQNADGKWQVEYEDKVIGFLPASANSYLENHEDELQYAEINEDGTVHIEFIVG